MSSSQRAIIEGTGGGAAPECGVEDGEREGKGRGPGIRGKL